MKTIAELDAERISTYQACKSSPGIHVIGRTAHLKLWLVHFEAVIAHFEACEALNAAVAKTTTMEATG